MMRWPSGENHDAADVLEFEFSRVNGPASVSPVVAFPHTKRLYNAEQSSAFSRNRGLKRYVLQGIKVLIPPHRRPSLGTLDVF
jgi:hypothetical protein